MSRKYASMLPKSELTPPTNVQIGQRLVVLFSHDPKSPEANFSDLDCGSTVVVEIKKNGTIVLENGFKFHSNGFGHASNNACVLSSHHAIDRLPNGMPSSTPHIPAKRSGHHSTF